MDIEKEVICQKKKLFVEELAQVYFKAGLINKMYYIPKKDLNDVLIGEYVHIEFADGRVECFSVMFDSEKAICKDIARAICRTYAI